MMALQTPGRMLQPDTGGLKVELKEGGLRSAEAGQKQGRGHPGMAVEQLSAELKALREVLEQRQGSSLQTSAVLQARLSSLEQALEHQGSHSLLRPLAVDFEQLVAETRAQSTEAELQREVQQQALEHQGRLQQQQQQQQQPQHGLLGELVVELKQLVGEARAQSIEAKLQREEVKQQGRQTRHVLQQILDNLPRRRPGHFVASAAAAPPPKAMQPAPVLPGSSSSPALAGGL